MAKHNYFHANGGSPKHHVKSRKIQRKQVNPKSKLRFSSNIVGANVARNGGSYKGRGYLPASTPIKTLPQYKRRSTVAGGSSRRRGQGHVVTFAPAGIAGGVLAYKGGKRVVGNIKARRAAGGLRFGRGQHRDSHGRFA